MGADMMVYRIEWRKGKTDKETNRNRDKVLSDYRKDVEDLFKPTPEKVAARLQGEEPPFSKEELLECVQTLNDACCDKRRDSTVIEVGEGEHKFLVMISGGPSWGDSPTDVFEAGTKLDQAFDEIG